MKKIISILLLSVAGITALSAQDGFEYKLRAGFNIGGSSPIPLPAEIRKIESYNPALALLLGADVNYWFSKQWGISSGLHFEIKGMKTQAQVKNYHIIMNVSDGGQEGSVDGMFTGHVETSVNNQYLTLPVLATYRFNRDWCMRLGFFGSYLMNGSFTGNAYDGYMRESTPTGTKIEVEKASYDFSDDLRKWNIGGQVGASWKAFQNFAVSADFTAAFNGLFPKDFTNISFNLYNIYLNIGFEYVF